MNKSNNLNNLMIQTLNSTRRRKAIKMTCDYYCLDYKIIQHDKSDCFLINSTDDSIDVSEEEFFESLTCQYNVLHT